jgi:hypothetical protein
MSLACRRPSVLRSAALIALAALGVHQLRYLLAYGDATGEQLAHQGHGYLAAGAPVLIGFALAALVAGLVHAVLGRAGAGPLTSSPRLRVPLYAAAILAVFATQELAEGALFAGHAGGLAAILANGGWLALPLAALAGALAALLDGALVRLEAAIAKAPRPAALPRAPRRSGAARSAGLVPRAATPLAFGLARRPPPAAA